MEVWGAETMGLKSEDGTADGSEDGTADAGCSAFEVPPGCSMSGPKA